MIGLHIISDFKKVDFSKLNLDEKNLKKFITEQLKLSGLTEIGNYYHTFGNNNEITCVIALAESHISIHTWPEKDYISLDIFVCNLGGDNSSKAKIIYNNFKKYFKPGDIEEVFIDRKTK